MFSFTIPAGIDVSAVCSRSEGRYAFSYAQLIPGKDGLPYLVGSNGRILCVTPVKGDPPPKGHAFIPARLGNKNILRASQEREVTISVNEEEETITRHDGKKKEVLGYEPCEGSFPAFQRLLPKGQDALKRHLCLTINAQDLLNLACAIGTGQVTLVIPPVNKSGSVESPILAMGRTADDSEQPPGIGIIMPLSVGTGYAQKVFTAQMENTGVIWELLETARQVA